ncbi:MAG: ligase-associated DNA damage response endonuclease PdeM [Pseudomonadota bacterium]
MLELKPERVGLNEYNTQRIALGGSAFIADQSGALYCPAADMLIVADLHLEKASSYARGGQFLPPYDTRETLMRLAEVIDRFEAGHVVALGDSLHDRQAGARIDAQDLEILHIMQDDRRWTWITGNHDPEIPAILGGEVRAQVRTAGVTLRHEPHPGPVTHEIAGHMHPAARLSMYGHSIRRPCFLGNGNRLILPAFGTLTGGLNVLDGAFLPLIGTGGMKVWMMGQEGLYPVATRRLRGD